MFEKTELYDLGDGVWEINQGMVRCFLILGEERALLFDSGAEECDIMGLIRSVTDLPVTLVQSHGDGDHTANSARFPEILAHPAEFDNICRFRPEVRERLVPVTEGAQFDLGGRVLRVLEMPGHTPGSIGLLEEERRILFSGDTVSLGPVFLFGPNRDIGVFRETLEKLRARNDFDAAYPCHNTCPVPASILSSLIAAVDGAMDGSLEGHPAEWPVPGEERPLCYSVDGCGILYNP